MVFVGVRGGNWTAWFVAQRPAAAGLGLTLLVKHLRYATSRHLNVAKVLSMQVNARVEKINRAIAIFHGLKQLNPPKVISVLRFHFRIHKNLFYGLSE